MIVKSLHNEKSYFWVKVPRTGTMSYEQLFFPELYSPENSVIHQHVPFFNMHKSCGNPKKISGGFSVVRDPIDRFISSVKYLSMKRNLFKPKNKKNYIQICQFCGEVTVFPFKENTDMINFVDFLKDEKTFYDFIYSIFDKNCELKPGLNLYDSFQTKHTGLIESIFLTQTRLSYHPKVKIFKYENLSEFNSWIESFLGYDTTKLTQVNSSKEWSINIDVTTKKFKDLVRYLYHDDFQVFGYA